MNDNASPLADWVVNSPNIDSLIRSLLGSTVLQGVKGASAALRSSTQALARNLKRNALFAYYHKTKDQEKDDVFWREFLKFIKNLGYRPDFQNLNLHNYPQALDDPECLSGMHRANAQWSHGWALTTHAILMKSLDMSTQGWVTVEPDLANNDNEDSLEHDKQTG